MTSKTAICNLALTKLGVSRITNIDEGTETAKTLLAVYDIILAAELRKYPWSFAKKRDSLAALTEIPSWGFDNYFQLPNGCVRLLSIEEYYVGYPMTGASYINGDNSPFYIEGKKIATSLGAPLKVSYIGLEEDTEQFDPLFTLAFAYALAVAVGEKLTGSTSKDESNKREYLLTIKDAMKVNSIELPPTVMRDGSFLLSRVAE